MSGPSPFTPGAAGFFTAPPPQEAGMVGQQPSIVGQQTGMVLWPPHPTATMGEFLPPQPPIFPHQLFPPQQSVAFAQPHPAFVPQQPQLSPPQNKFQAPPPEVPSHGGMVGQQPAMVGQQPSIVGQQTGMVFWPPPPTATMGEFLPPHPQIFPHQLFPPQQSVALAQPHPAFVPQQPQLLPPQNMFRARAPQAPGGGFTSLPSRDFNASRQVSVTSGHDKEEDSSTAISEEKVVRVQQSKTRKISSLEDDTYKKKHDSDKEHSAEDLQTLLEKMVALKTKLADEYETKDYCNETVELFHRMDGWRQALFQACLRREGQPHF